MNKIENYHEYKEFISQIKTKIKNSQIIALRAVNKELIELYWDIGESIVKKQEEQRLGQVCSRDVSS